MKIGVSGASGQLGKAVLEQLKLRGEGNTVIGISRTPESIPEPAKGRFGDYDQPDSLKEAYEGLDRLLIIPSSDLRPGARTRQFQTAIDTAKKAHVGQVVLMSSSAVQKASGLEMFSDYVAAEQYLVNNLSKWTILRMNYYAESFAQIASMSISKGVLAGLGENRVAFISRNDVAAAAAGILLTAGHNGATYNATGAAAISGAERAAIVSEITGKPFRFLPLSEEELRKGLEMSGVPTNYINSMIDIEMAFLGNFFEAVTSDVEFFAGHPPKPFREVVTELL
jgi:NAD(P)H dehydrogenase (quinone)